MLLLQARKIDIDNQTIQATDGVRQMFVYIPKRNPIMVPQEGGFFEAENIGKRLVVKNCITSEGAARIPGAFTLEASKLNVTVDGSPLFWITEPGYVF